MNEQTPTDFLGNELKIGDKVVFCNQNGKTLQIRYIKEIVNTSHPYIPFTFKITKNPNLSGKWGETTSERLYKITKNKNHE